MDLSDHIQSRLHSLPTKPGCYLMKDADGEIIYIGKAVNLRSRVRSYFHTGVQQNRKTIKLVERIADVEWIIVASELEALILEMTLIKQHRPHYNVRLKDDKRYPYVKVHWADDFPKVTVTREMVNDGSRYFGPYTSVWAVHQTLDLLRKIFPYLTCDRVITGQDSRACLYYDIKLCNAPCIGVVNQDEYRLMISDLMNFLDGKTGPIVQRLRLEMDDAAGAMKFEKAAVKRDQIRAIETVVERQKVVSPDYVDSDVIAMARSDREACVQVFFIRGGKLIGREYFLLDGADDTPDPEVMTGFLEQFYDKSPTVPPQVLLPHEIEETNIIRQWLNQKRGGEKVKLIVPKRGTKKELVRMAAENAMDTLNALQSSWEADKHRQTQALGEIQDALRMDEPPTRIECYDISNTQGTAAVGSMVVFERGVPSKSLYRRFNIKTVVGPDDFASMEEVLTRRFARWRTAQAEAAEKKPGHRPDLAFGLLPDLLIVDGGKGQLSRAVDVVERFGLLGRFKVVGLAKREEEIFTPGNPAPVMLARKSEGLYLVQRIRDEAHRFAITAHRNRRSREGIASVLDTIPGIGPVRRKALMGHFGSLDKIRAASVEELAAVPGITEKVALTVKTGLG
ncbi:MAG TPA: excinuclease ABC subunit UvrC [Anaerolineales bacterium]|nr:excinuclease ABC subunit UvrC [Anaerolineales bacterium]